MRLKNGGDAVHFVYMTLCFGVTGSIKSPGPPDAILFTSRGPMGVVARSSRPAGAVAEWQPASAHIGVNSGVGTSAHMTGCENSLDNEPGQAAHTTEAAAQNEANHSARFIGVTMSVHVS